MLSIKDYDLEELKQIFMKLEEKSFRAEQVFRWLYKEKVSSFDEMTNLSLELRNKLKEKFTLSTFTILKKQVSKDGTKKYLFELADGNTIETVVITYKHGHTVCISTQVGCKIGCKFCASSYTDFARNLTSGEIVEQLLSVEKDEDIRISNVVYMGIRRTIR